MAIWLPCDGSDHLLSTRGLPNHVPLTTLPQTPNGPVFPTRHMRVACTGLPLASVIKPLGPKMNRDGPCPVSLPPSSCEVACNALRPLALKVRSLITALIP